MVTLKPDLTDPDLYKKICLSKLYTQWSQAPKNRFVSKLFGSVCYFATFTLLYYRFQFATFEVVSQFPLTLRIYLDKSHGINRFISFR